MHNIVTIGGGSGHSQVLIALKDIPGVAITGICPSTDSGGSTGILRTEYEGSGYTGDLTKCIAALCNNAVIAQALMYRYENGPLDSHSVKNILFHALEKVSSTEQALQALGEMTHIAPHRVIPVTTEKTELCATLILGNTIVGETNIDYLASNPLWNPEHHAISDIFLKPEVSASPIALSAIIEADYIIVCPGDLYSSIIPTLLPEGMQSAVRTSRAKIIIILNIMTKKGETDDYTAQDFLETIENRLGRKADYVLCNNAVIPDEILAIYSLESKVEFDTLESIDERKLILVPLAQVTSDGQVVSDPKVISETIRLILKNV